MQSRAPTVAKYVQQQPQDRQPVLKKLRRLCRASLPGHQEGIDYGMPVYKRAGAVEVAFASQRQYIVLYVLDKAVLDRHRDTLTGCKMGKGCIRYARPAKIDFEQVTALLQEVAKSKGTPC